MLALRFVVDAKLEQQARHELEAYECSVKQASLAVPAQTSVRRGRIVRIAAAAGGGARVSLVHNGVVLSEQQGAPYTRARRKQRS